MSEEKVLTLRGKRAVWAPAPAGGGATSWNDLTDKPFGKEIIKEVVLEETEVVFEGSAESNPLEIYLDLSFEPGETMVVEFDGTRYERTNTDEYTSFYKGNGSIQMPGVLEDTGEPFYINQPSPSETVFKLKAAETATHRFAIYRIGAVITKIPNEYLPKAESTIAPIRFDIDFESYEKGGCSINFSYYGTIEETIPEIDRLYNTGARICGYYSTPDFGYTFSVIYGDPNLFRGVAWPDSEDKQNVLHYIRISTDGVFVYGMDGTLVSSSTT